MNKLIILLTLLASALYACQSVGGSESAKNRAPRDAKVVYKTYCVACHGMDGKMMFGGAANLAESTISMEARINIITHGQGGMTAFKKTLSKEEVIAVAEYLDTFIAKN